uniref:Uncharacterized protein n=1 Tax=Romanomermis culicivorax TaxID=13658 RepID=A0A915ILZ2_ROMCU
MCCNACISLGSPRQHNFIGKPVDGENQEILKCAPSPIVTPAVSPIRKVASPSNRQYFLDSTEKNVVIHGCPFDSTPANFSSDPAQNLNASPNSSNR